MSGFINVGHTRNSHKDIRIPIFHKDQYIALLDEDLFEGGYVIKDNSITKETKSTKDNSLKLDFCFNQFVYDYKLHFVFLKEVELLKATWEKMLRGKEEHCMYRLIF